LPPVGAEYVGVETPPTVRHPEERASGGRVLALIVPLRDDEAARNEPMALERAEHRIVDRDKGRVVNLFFF